MKISQIPNCTLSVFHENLLPQLSPLHKKIGMVVLIAIGLIAAYFILNLQLKKPKVITPKETPPADKDKLPTDLGVDKQTCTYVDYERAIADLKDQMKSFTLPDSFQNFQSGVCIVKCSFNGGSASEKSLFKNVDGSPVKMDWPAEADKIANSWKIRLSKVSGINKLDWFFLIKCDDDQKFHQIRGEITIEHTSHNGQSSFEKISCKGLSDGESAIVKSLTIIKEMGIPNDWLPEEFGVISKPLFSDSRA